MRPGRGLVDGKAPGQTPKLNEAQRQALVRIVESGPIPAVHEVVRWRLIDLAQWVWDEFQISISKQTLSRELRAMGFRKLSARARHHAQNEHAVEAFKKKSRPRGGHRAPRAAGARIEIWFQDEARVGQKNKITAVGLDVAHGPVRPTINAPARPISSAPSARRKARPRLWSSRIATQPP